MAFVTKRMICLFYYSLVSALIYEYTNVNTIEIPRAFIKFGKFVLIQMAIQVLIIVLICKPSLVCPLGFITWRKYVGF
jgi:hypothetical protein